MSENLLPGVKNPRWERDRSAWSRDFQGFVVCAEMRGAKCH